jgi:hypothetical protein
LHAQQRATLYKIKATAPWQLSNFPAATFISAMLFFSDQICGEVTTGAAKDEAGSKTSY